MTRCQPLALDQFVFTVVRHLADTTEAPLDANQNLAKWLLNLTELVSEVLKKFSCSVDMLGLVTYLVHQMRSSQSFVLAYTLNQIVVKLFGWSDFVVNQMQPENFELLAAGPVLAMRRHSKTDFTHEQFKQSTQALKNLFWDRDSQDHDKLCLRILVQLAVQAQHVMSCRFETDSVVFMAR